MCQGFYRGIEKKMSIKPGKSNENVKHFNREYAL